ncbi:cbb3-type cytochrome c oxidase subunit 3 [Massilia sp. RP-1-19]|uniref:Cbb3-type cytochrome c oxidase subunit 3 n=1 Tax=Massilia polaris TaxID=2728846 RepID=A0A848HIQ5_9BURK|nr:CcoQ/FixQ family Cbb3-type cytochrome c oxidase assembly chaperone [Massilia polaris]NML60952.1 cbb3-type cytochrome c oxidase subunit 3 [Massilia polaris]
MALEQIFDSASSVMTVISFTTFLGILLWTFVLNRGRDFDAQAALPFADAEADDMHARENGHG